jgi:prophage regulatory protein
MSGDRFLRLPEVKKKLGVSETTVWRLIKRGELARPAKIGKYTTVWLESEITSYMDKLIKQRDAV